MDDDVEDDDFRLTDEISEDVDGDGTATSSIVLISCRTSAISRSRNGISESSNVGDGDVDACEFGE